jgi:hypothetical protein
MNAPNPTNGPNPERDEAVRTETNGLNCIDVFIEGKGDKTVRPMRSPILRQIRPDRPPPETPPK